MEERDYSYTLKKLDEWHFNRISERYTSGVEKRVMEKMFSRLRENSLFEKFGSSLHNFSVEEVKKEARDYFSRRYSAFEDMLNDPDFIQDIPEGVRNEYITPAYKSFGKLKEFVNEAKALSNKKFPDNLTEDNINRIFKKTFPNFEDYINMINRGIENTLPMLDLLVS